MPQRHAKALEEAVFGRLGSAFSEEVGGRARGVVISFSPPANASVRGDMCSEAALRKLIAAASLPSSSLRVVGTVCVDAWHGQNSNPALQASGSECC